MCKHCNWGGEGYPAYEVVMKASDAQKQAQQQSQQEAQFLQSMMQTQFGEQQQLLNKVLIPQLTQMAQNPQGFGAQALAAMQSQLINTVGTQFASQEKSLQNQFASNNLAGLGSGVQEAIKANLAGNAAGFEGQGLSNIAIQNAQLKNQQQQFALGGLGAADSLLGQAPQSAGLALEGNKNTFNQATQIHNQGGFFSNLMGGLLGAGLNFATGGLSGMLNGGSFLEGGGQALGGQPITG